MKNLFKLLLFTAFLAFVAPHSSNAQPGVNYSLQIKNVDSTAADSLVFDIYIYNTGTDSLKFQGLAAGITWNYGGLIKGGTITVGSRSGYADGRLPVAQRTPTVSFDTISLQYKIQWPIATASAAAPIPVSGLRLGHFYVKGSVAFSEGYANLQWSFAPTTANTLKTQLGAYIGNSANPPTYSSTSTNITKPYKCFVVGNPIF